MHNQSLDNDAGREHLSESDESSEEELLEKEVEEPEDESEEDDEDAAQGDDLKTRLQEETETRAHESLPADSSGVAGAPLSSGVAYFIGSGIISDNTETFGYNGASADASADKENSSTLQALLGLNLS